MFSSLSNKNLKNVVQITDKDLDGVSAYIVSKLVLKDYQVTPRYATPDDVNAVVENFLQEWTKDTVLIITDLSVDIGVSLMLERKVKEGYTVFLVDHHKTALGLNIYPWARVALDISGLKTSATSYLLHLYTVSLLDFHPNPLLSQYAELVRLYDTWEWSEKPSASSSLAKDLNDLLYLVDLKTYADMLLEHMNGASYGVDFYLPRRAELVLEPERARISAYLKKKVKQVTKGNVTIAGKTYYVGVVSAESYISELGNDLCKKNEDLDFIAIVNFDRSRISLRTIRDIDMSFIAQCFAGGGHEKAAGFSLKGNYDTSVFINLFLSGIFM